MILAGDVGGTKTNLGLFERAAGKLKPIREESYASPRYPSLVAIVEEFLASHKRRKKPDRLAVGVAGPVTAGRSQVVNLRWPVDAKRLSRQLGISPVHVLNDVEATAWGIPELAARQLVNLTPGLRGRAGNAALIAAGTGLGMAMLVWDGERFRAAPSEGGHQDFAPRDDLEIALLRFMRRRYGRVSLERIISGSGFSAIYRFLTENGWGAESDRMTRRLAESEDPNAVISRAGIEGHDPVAEKTVEMYVSMFGSAAGDLALTAKAVAGVYIGGGIAPKILPKLKSGEFVRGFRGKGRLSPLLEQIPVRVILESRTALLGAAVCAERLGPASRTRSLRKSPRTKK